MTKILTSLYDRLTGYDRVTVMETDRELVLHKGRFQAILRPGEHRIKRGSLRDRHSVDRLRFVSAYDSALLRSRPDLVEAHLTVVEAGPGEVVIVSRDDRPVEMLMPDTRALYLRDAGPFTVERFDVTGDLAVPPALVLRLDRAQLSRALTKASVAPGHVGMLFVDGALAGRLEPGQHAFFAVGRPVAVKQVDLRARVHEVTGQEVLTKDRVTLRINLTAGYRVIDPELAVSAVADFAEALHRALQLALRRRVGAMTLDQLLAEKGAVDAETAASVKPEMAQIGLDLGEVSLRDVVLPGDMREILNQVVAAEKQAEANVIRRREETNATRALLNTAKVMAENPVMLRLKELEALESIAGKVESLTVHNGTRGLMSEIVQLRD